MGIVKPTTRPVLRNPASAQQQAKPHEPCPECRTEAGPISEAPVRSVQRDEQPQARVVLDLFFSGWLDSDSYDNPGDSTTPTQLKFQIC